MQIISSNLSNGAPSKDSALTTAFKMWVTCPRPSPRAKLRLYCFPHAGGSASSFRQWADDLPANIEICPIQYPGRENRMLETPFTHLPPLVETLTPLLASASSLPFAFFGHSMGTLISFEVARQLRRLGAPQPVALFLSGCRAPQVTEHDPPIHELPAAEFLAAVRNYNGMPKEVAEHQELMELMLPILRADFTIVETYASADEPPLDIPIMAFGGMQDSHVRRDQLQAWREQTRSSFVLRMFPGDHFYLQGARPMILQAIMQDLARLHKS